MADAQIDAIVRALDGFTSKVTQKVTLDVTANLIETTPRDTGWAASNWVPAIGKNHSGSNFSGPRSERASLVPGAEAQQADGIASITGYDVSQGKVFISNNVPYIKDLNEGSSKKAPEAFVQIAIDKAVTVDIKA